MYVLTLSVLVLRMLFLRIEDVLMGFNTHLEMAGNKVLNKVVAIVCRRLKSNDDVVGFGRFEFGNINTNVNHEVDLPFIKSDTVIIRQRLSL